MKMGKKHIYFIISGECVQRKFAVYWQAKLTMGKNSVSIRFFLTFRIMNWKPSILFSLHFTALKTWRKKYAIVWTDRASPHFAFNRVQNLCFSIFSLHFYAVLFWMILHAQHSYILHRKIVDVTLCLRAFWNANCGKWMSRNYDEDIGSYCKSTMVSIRVWVWV